MGLATRFEGFGEGFAAGLGALVVGCRRSIRKGGE